MSARVSYVLVALNVFFLSNCVTVNSFYEPDTSSKIELTPLFISGHLNDIIIIPAPLRDNTTYYLSRPDGETTPLYLSVNISQHQKLEQRYDFNEVNINDLRKDKYKMFIDRCFGHKTFLDKHFMIGPIDENDHGNWVLSAYVKGNGDWIELFQVITVEIIETIPANPAKPKLSAGETFEVSFAHPIKDLESCEIIPPRSTFDRFYDRSRHNLDSCGFRIPNVTKADEGTWKIVGVSKIVYESTVFLEVYDIS